VVGRALERWWKVARENRQSEACRILAAPTMTAITADKGLGVHRQQGEPRAALARIAMT